MRKYAVSACEEVFPVPKQLPVIWTVWAAVASNAPTVTIAGVHGGGGDGAEDDDLEVEGECDIEGAVDVDGAGDVKGESGEEDSGDGEGDGEGEGDAEGEGDGEGDVEASPVGVPVG